MVFSCIFYYKASDKPHKKAKSHLTKIIRNYNAVVTQSRDLNYCK